MFSESNTLDPSGSSAQSIAGLFWFMLALSAVAFVIYVGGLIIGVRRGPADANAGSFEDGPPPLDEAVHPWSRRWLIGGGLVLPAVSVVAVIWSTVATMNTITEDRDDVDLTIDVTGKQWQWDFDYGDLGATSTDELHIPANQTVLLRLHSDDVIHSFWVPALAGKMDLIPGRTNELLIDALKPGRYDGYCAEFCGLNHAHMTLIVVAHEPDDFDAWITQQQSSEDS